MKETGKGIDNKTIAAFSRRYVRSDKNGGPVSLVLYK